ncbi:MAG: hypothetical protein AB7N91_20635 [Candidatus Tectimicrobiota bacterium]
MAPLYPVLAPSQAGLLPTATTTLRYAVRTDGTQRFLFLHHFQDHLALPDLPQVQVTLHTVRGPLRVPDQGTMTVRTGTAAILPFNMPFGEVRFRSATVQPFCAFTQAGRAYQVFVALEGIVPEIVLERRVTVAVQAATHATRQAIR